MSDKATPPGIPVLFCYTGFPHARTLLRERLRGTPLRVVEVDPSRPLEEQVAEAAALIPSMARITAAVRASLRCPPRAGRPAHSICGALHPGKPHPDPNRPFALCD